MNRQAETEGAMLRRIAALLGALATLADRAGEASLPVRFLLLSILRYAEAVAWRLLAVPSTQPQSENEAPTACGSGPDEAARLAFSFRMLAQLLSGLAAQAFVRRTPGTLLYMVLTAAGSVVQVAAVVPAHDTS